MPTPQLLDYLITLRRDTVSLVPCQHPECAAYRLSLAERIGIISRLLETAPHNSPGKRLRPTSGTRDKGDGYPRKGGVSPSASMAISR